MRAERWCWVVITRKPGQLRTYVNGRLCSDIKLESVKKDKKDDKPKAEEVDGDEGKDGAATVGPKPQLQEKFVLDPQFLALFASDGSGKDQTPRGAARCHCSFHLLAAHLRRASREPVRPRCMLAGLAIKYIRVTSKVMDQKEIADELHRIRSADEEAEVLQAAESSRAEQLSLQPLYARPPPVWLHPAFAAEFADPFIAGQPFFEEGAMHISLEVLTLVLDEMLKESGLGCELSHAARSALNTANTQLKDARKLAALDALPEPHVFRG